LTGFLASGSFSPGLDFHQWLQHAGAAERKLVASKICRFDSKIFLELGNDFQQILRMKDIQPSFLGKMEMAPSIG